MFCSLPEALQELSRSRPIIVVDDEDRENEGDLVMPIAFSSPQWVNFFITHARGLLCTPISASIAEQCSLSLMPSSSNIPHHSCNFALSVDAYEGITTGISAFERFHTMSLFLQSNIAPHDFVTPGHVFPLIGAEGGLAVRQGHTEASLYLCRLLSVPEVAMICEILNEDGTMARGEDLLKFAQKHDLKMLTIEDLREYIAY